jgi:hypothetical protein
MSKEPTDVPGAGKAAPRPDRTRPRRPHVPERMLIRRGILLNFWLTPSGCRIRSQTNYSAIRAANGGSRRTKHYSFRD